MTHIQRLDEALGDVLPLKTLLIAGFDRIIKASEEITEEDLRTARIDDAVQEKLDENT
jgi:hypothetical protein